MKIKIKKDDMKEKNQKLIHQLLLLIIITIIIILIKIFNIIDYLLLLINTIIPFFIGFIICWLLIPLSERIQKKFYISEKKANNYSILISIFVLMIFLLTIIPLLVLQIISFTDKLPQIIVNFNENIPIIDILKNYDYGEIFEKLNMISLDQFTKYSSYIVGLMNDILNSLINFISSFFTIILKIIAGYIIAFYFMGSIKQFTINLLNLIPLKNKKENKIILKEISGTIYSYVKSLVLVSSIVATLMTIGGFIIGIPSAFLFGTIAGITNIIPYLGPILGGIPILIVALSLGYKQAILVLLLIGIIQFIEGNLLQPKIMSKSTNLHPVTIIVGLLIFAQFFGIFGMILSTPMLSILNIIIKNSRFKNKIKI